MLAVMVDMAGMSQKSHKVGFKEVANTETNDNTEMHEEDTDHVERVIIGHGQTEVNTPHFTRTLKKQGCVTQPGNSVMFQSPAMEPEAKNI